MATAYRYEILPYTYDETFSITAVPLANSSKSTASTTKLTKEHATMQTLYVTLPEAHSLSALAKERHLLIAAAGCETLMHYISELIGTGPGQERVRKMIGEILDIALEATTDTGAPPQANPTTLNDREL